MVERIRKDPTVFYLPFHTNTYIYIYIYIYFFFTVNFLKLHQMSKLGPKNKNPEVFITKKAKKMNHGSPLFPTNIYIFFFATKDIDSNLPEKKRKWPK